MPGLYDCVSVAFPFLSRWFTASRQESRTGTYFHRRTGNSDFLGSKRNLGKAGFKRSFHVFVFEEIDILYFNLKSAW